MDTTGNELPRFREEQISEKLGEVLKDIYIPDDVLARISSALEYDKEHAQKDADAKREKLAQRLDAIRNRMSQAYADKAGWKDCRGFLAAADESMAVGRAASRAVDGGPKGAKDRLRA